MFQNTKRLTIEGIPGVLNVSDDILIHAPSTEEHNRRLHILLECLQEKGITVNKEKSQLIQTCIRFFGLVFSEHGVSPDPQKVDSIQNAYAPQSQAEVRSLLGMANYSSCFIPNLSTITEPLRPFTEKDIKFEWNLTHDIALQQPRDSLTREAVCAYFDQAKATEVWVDGGPVGLGAMLTQTD